jgi:hypothetical protein
MSFNEGIGYFEEIVGTDYLVEKEKKAVKQAKDFSATITPSEIPF